MRRLQLATEDAIRADLASALHRSGELRFMHRLDAVLLISVGHSCYEVAHWFGENARTIERWVHAYELHGSDGLQDHPHAGRPTKLTPQQSQQLAPALAGEPGACGYSEPRWSGKLLARHVERNYGVHLSLRQCQRLLQGKRTLLALPEGL